MAFKQVTIDGQEYVPAALLSVLAAPQSKALSKLVAAAIEAVRADDDVDLDGGLERWDRSFSTLKRAVRAVEREARAESQRKPPQG